jgi:YgiT-type zinc finger domain-containing protein
MKTCDVCGNGTFRREVTDEFFRVGTEAVLIERVPALVCERCGEATFDRETVEKVRRLVHEHSQPAHRVEVEAFAFA